jgi:hypothetical protein
MRGSAWPFSVCTSEVRERERLTIAVSPHPATRLMHLIHHNQPPLLLDEIANRSSHILGSTPHNLPRALQLGQAPRLLPHLVHFGRRGNHVVNDELAVAVLVFADDEAIGLELDDDNLGGVGREEVEDVEEKGEVGAAGYEGVLLDGDRVARWVRERGSGASEKGEG